MLCAGVLCVNHRRTHDIGFIWLGNVIDGRQPTREAPDEQT
jgi:hypothetical protein